MFWAAFHKETTDVIDELVRRGAEVNTFDEQWRTPLHHAVISGNATAVVRLLHHGADLDAKDEVCCALARRAHS